MKKFLQATQNIIWIIMTVLFSVLFFDIIYQDSIGRGFFGIIKKGILFGLILCFYFLIYYLLKKVEKKLLQIWKIVLPIYLFVLLILQIYFGNMLRITPQYDFGAVYNGAVDWVVTGSITNYIDYYCWYPNNLGELLLLKNLFVMVAKIGSNDFYMAAIVFNCLLNIGMVATVFLICKKKLSIVEAYMSLLFFTLCPPMYLLGAAFYTDVITMFFPVFLYYLYLVIDELILKEQKSKKEIAKSVMYILIFGLCAFFGKILKPTVLIMVVAILIECFLNKKIKTILLFVISVVLFSTIGNIALEEMVFDKQIEKSRAVQMETPFETWVYMGLEREMGFTGDATELSRSVEDPLERKQVMRQAIVEKMKTYSFTEFCDHLRKKGVAVFSDGTFELSSMFMLGFEKDNPLKDYITLAGANYVLYWECCSLFWYINIGLFVFYLWKKLFLIVKKKQSIEAEIGLPLSYLGLLLFFWIWEVHARYSVNFFGVYVILAIFGLKNIFYKNQ